MGASLQSSSTFPIPYQAKLGIVFSGLMRLPQRRCFHHESWMWTVSFGWHIWKSSFFVHYKPSETSYSRFLPLTMCHYMKSVRDFERRNATVKSRVWCLLYRTTISSSPRRSFPVNTCPWLDVWKCYIFANSWKRLKSRKVWEHIYRIWRHNA